MWAFFSELANTLGSGNPRVWAIVKWVGYVVLFVLAVSDKSYFDLLVIDPSTNPPKTKTVSLNIMSWHPSINSCVCAAIFALWIAIAVGVAWIRAKSLKIGPRLRYDIRLQAYSLPIMNAGSADAMVPVRLESIRAFDGSEIPQSRLPFEVARLTLSRGFRHFVKLFESAAYDRTVSPARVVIRFADINSFHYALGSMETIWLELSVDSADKIHWISVTAVDQGEAHEFLLIANLDTPPFVKWPRRK